MPVPVVFTDMAARVRNWGRWGPEDEIGTLNLIDQAARRRAAAAVVSGRAFALGLPLSEAEGIQLGFVEGRVNPTRTMVQVNQPVNADQPEWVCFSEDVLTLATQCATHWDALAHSSYGGVIYNGYPASTVSADGAARCGIHRLGTVVSRGVLLDVARALGRDVLSPATPSRPTIWTRRARWPTSRWNRVTSFSYAPARWCTFDRTSGIWWPTPGPRPD